MARIPFDLEDFFRANGTRQQINEAIRVLGGFLGNQGRAQRVCEAWQQRFEQALRTDIPDWKGFAGFRCITDFNIPLDNLQTVFPPPPSGGLPEEDVPRAIDTLDQIWHAHWQYFDRGRDLYSGKLLLSGRAERHFLEQLAQMFKTLGGQAGNILWLWYAVFGQGSTHVPYFTKDLAEFNGLDGLTFLRWSGGAWRLQPLRELSKQYGVGGTAGRSWGAPAGGSAVVVSRGRRLIFQFRGLRDVHASTVPWKKVRFTYWDGTTLGPELDRDPNDLTWPAINLLCDCYVDDSTEVLVIRLADENVVREAFCGRVDFAILGGINSIFIDDWLKRDPVIQARLVEVAERQLTALAHGCGIRIGIELSGVPEREYAQLLKRWCQGDKPLVVALGINGVDELPDVTGLQALAGKELGKNPCPPRLFELWLDPEALDPNLRPEARDPRNTRGDHFEYITYLRAQKLAEAVGVRTLLAHTNTVDIVLRKDADPGSLFHAQLADMIGKGLVIVALYMRGYSTNWRQHLNPIPLAIKPEAIKRLGMFARDFEGYENKPGAEESLLESGYWLARSTTEYSVAVVPVMWPDLPVDINPTGAGDMTFGAFFRLGGV